MAARQTVLITVATAEELQELEQALGTGDLEAVVVDIPEGAAALQSAREFRRIANAARAADVELEISTDDPLRRELAHILGMRLAPNRSHDAPVPEPAAAPDDATRPIEPAVEESDDYEHTEPATAYQPFQVRHGAPTTTLPRSSSELDASEPSFSFVITPPGSTRFSSGAMYERYPAPASESTGDFVVTPNAPPVRLPSPRRGRLTRRLALLSVLVTVAIIAGVLALLLLPSATIAIAPVHERVSTELTYGVAQPGRSWDIVVQPVPITSTLTFTATVPATGERFEPDGTARGTIQLTNASTAEVVVPAGTTLTGENGVAFTTVADVAVPAADPFGTLTFGNTQVEVVATVAGPDGNLDADLLHGQLDSGIFYVNHTPIEGGTMRRVATVSQADVDGLRQQATIDLQRQADVAIAAKLSDGQQLLEGSERRGGIETTFDHPVGADAESVTINASMTVSALAYSLDDVHEQARVMIADRLMETGDGGVEFIADSLTITAPSEISGSNGTAFTVSASGQTRAVIPAAELDALKHDLAGMSSDAALARIRQIPGVGEVQIETSPDWVGERLPRLASRIEISVTDAARVPAETTTSGP